MIASIILAAVVVVAAFSVLMYLHIRTMNKLKIEYDLALHELSLHPSDTNTEEHCRAAGKNYYRFMRIREHATLNDFPLPYIETPELDSELVEHDIAIQKEEHHPAA